MFTHEIPDLTFPMVEFGPHSTPWDMRVLLGAAVDMPPSEFQARLSLVKGLHEGMVSALVAGGSRATAVSRWNQVRSFFRWADEAGHGKELTLAGVENTFVRWSEHLLARVRRKEYANTSAHTLVCGVGPMLDRLLNRHYPIVKQTRIKKGKESGRFSKSAGDKLLLKETAEFGAVLIGLCNQLTDQAVWGPLPVTIDVKEKTLKLWARLPKPGLRQRTTKQTASEKRASDAKREAFQANKSLASRCSLINYRIEAELLTFIAQTGMNLEQAYKLEIADFRYTSHVDGYEVRAYKARRAGPVLFEIFSEYRQHFERYLEWRRLIFTDHDDKLLFPLIRAARVKAPGFHLTRALFHELSLKFVSSRALRKARINWFLRELSDPQQVADIAQHDLPTLMQVYSRPHPQVAMVEIGRFYQQTDSFIAPPAPGACIAASPEVLSDSPPGAPKPDCVTGAGCLFCDSHRDVDSSDYMWSLASYRYLKSLELASFRPPVRQIANSLPHPAEIAVTRLTEKLRQFSESSEVHQSWVREALARVAEGEHHPLWDGFIRLQEAMQ